MGRDAKHLLIGSAARPEERKRLEEVIEGHPEIAAVNELLTMVLGPKALLVAARVDLDDRIDGGRVEEVSSEIDRDLREAVRDVTEVFIDATPGGGDSDACRGATPLRRLPRPSRRRTCGPSRGSAWPT